MQLEDVVVSGVTEFVRIYIILEYFKIFLNVHSLRRNIISCVIREYPKVCVNLQTDVR